MTLLQDLKTICFDNKYTKCYFSIIEAALNRETEGYSERHHILPKSIVNNNVTVRLTAREHYICHLLLPKMLSDETHRRKMWFALHKLINGNQNGDLKSRSSRLYETIKKNHRASCSKRSKLFWGSLSKEERQKLRPSGKDSPHYAKECKLETRIKIGTKNKGKLAGSKHPLWQTGHTQQSKEKCRQNAARATVGKKWYHHPKTGVERFFIVGKEESGFIQGRLRRVTI